MRTVKIIPEPNYEFVAINRTRVSLSRDRYTCEGLLTGSIFTSVLPCQYLVSAAVTDEANARAEAAH